MRNLWREYRLIAVLIVVAMASYVLYNRYRQDILAYSLNAIGDRLVAMVDGDAGARGVVTERYERFKQRILRREVAPEQVESMAANVLNLSNSGASLTQQEAEMVLEPIPHPNPPPESEPRLESSIVDEQALHKTGLRLGEMLVFNKEMTAAVSENPEARKKLAENMRYHLDGGIGITLDDDAQAMFSEREWAYMTKAMKRLQERHRIRWDDRLAESIRERRAHIRAERRALKSFDKTYGSIPDEAPATIDDTETENHNVVIRREVMTRALSSLKMLKELESMGYSSPVELDSVRLAVVHLMKKLPAASPDGSLDEARLEQYMDAYQQQFEAYLRVLEARLNKRQASSTDRG